MIAMIFEFWFDPEAPEVFQEYLVTSEEIRRELADVMGFRGVERFESCREPGKYVALGFFDDEAAVRRWRTRPEHRRAQSLGRARFFTDYRLRMAEVRRDYGPVDRTDAPTDSREFHDRSLASSRGRSTAHPLRRRFRELHAGGLFVMPNPWDVGSAVRLAKHVEALATTSSGLAWSLGKEDGELTRDELIAHVATLTASVGVPLSVDAERGFADDAAGVADTVAQLAAVGAAGCSIEDYDPTTDAIDEQAVAVERVAAAVEEAGRHGMVLTARCDNHLHGIDDFDDTLTRLTAYRDAGAEVLYAPGIRTAEQIREVVALGRPVNLLARPGMPALAELAELGARRVSTGGALARTAYDTLQAVTDAWRPLVDHDGHDSEAHDPRTGR